MTEMLQQLSDDQLALLGCLAAFALATLLLSISFHNGPARSEEQTAIPSSPLERQHDSERKAA